MAGSLKRLFSFSFKSKRRKDDKASEQSKGIPAAHGADELAYDGLPAEHVSTMAVPVSLLSLAKASDHRVGDELGYGSMQPLLQAQGQLQSMPASCS